MRQQITYMFVLTRKYNLSKLFNKIIGVNIDLSVKPLGR
jgi:hypothetical protein